MDLLSDILSHLKLSGTLYFRTSFTSPWSIEVPSFENVSRFHFAHRGRCLIRVSSELAPVMLEQGDLIIITRGAGHLIFSEPDAEMPSAHLDEVVAKSGFTGHGALVYGEPGSHHETQLICGHFAFDEDASHPLIDALPSHIHIKNYGHSAGSWMENTLRVIGSEAGQDLLGSDLIALKMSEIIYAQAIRSFLSESGRDQKGLAGFLDPQIARALRAMHESPENRWTLEGLSRISGMSRTSLANRFSESLSVTPLAYLTQWRMQIARQKLVDSNDSMIDIAESVGYQSEAAFSRVFKKQFGMAPAGYRRHKKSLQP
ncbi:MAG: AraC family transcriptional regulator [Pseudomonadota bacterium]